MSELFSTLVSAFDANGWSYQKIEGRSVIETGFEAHHTRVPLHAQAFEELNAISVVSRSLVTIPHTHNLQVMEVLMRTNQQLTIGNFESDTDDSTVFFRATNLFPKDAVDRQIISALVHASIAEMDRITPSLTIVSRTAAGELDALDIPALLRRDDLLPTPTPTD